MPLQDCTCQPLRERLKREKDRQTRFDEIPSKTRERLQANPLDAEAALQLVTVGEELYPG